MTLDPRLPESFRQAERLLASGRCLGLKLHPVVHGYAISAYGEAVYAFAERPGAPIVMHTGEAGCMPEDFVPFADRHPSVITVLSHLGCSPDGDGMHQCRAIEQSRANNLYTDTSSWHSMEMNLLERAVQAVGADRILFGTDSGCYFSPAQRARIDCALLHTVEKKKILFKNALRLFPQLREDYTRGCAALSLSRNPAVHYAAAGFLVYMGQKKRKRERRKWSFHFHTASFFRFMAANLSFTQFVT